MEIRIGLVGIELLLCSSWPKSLYIHYMWRVDIFYWHFHIFKQVPHSLSLNRMPFPFLNNSCFQQKKERKKKKEKKEEAKAAAIGTAAATTTINTRKQNKGCRNNNSSSSSSITTITTQNSKTITGSNNSH